MKVEDRGFKNTDLARFPDRETRRQTGLKEAIANLTKPERPDRLTKVRYPNSLYELRTE